MKKLITITFILMIYVSGISQAIRIPGSSNNFPSMTGRKLAATTIEVRWNAPAVNGREGKIWGTNIAYFGNQVLGFGSNALSPWRAGADECTTISFSTDVKINGSILAAGKYALFLELGENESTWVFNKNADAWGSYFYNKDLDVLHVKTTQIKNQPNIIERMSFDFSNQTQDRVDLSLNWEQWSIPMRIEVDKKATILAEIKQQMTTELGFDPPSMIAAANWCVQNDVNLDQALGWINDATSPLLGGVTSFNALSTKAQILEKLNKGEEAKLAWAKAIDMGTVMELHQYGRSLLNKKQIDQAGKIFELNYKKHNGIFPSSVGLMRYYSAKGDLKKALVYAKESLEKAPDDLNRENIKGIITKLEKGESI